LSQGNIDIVKLLYEQWSQGDYDNRDPFAEDLDFEMSGWVMLQSKPIKARGVDGMASVWREVLQGWDQFRTGPIEELIETGDQIVVLSRLVARGKHSGIEVNAPRAALFTFREGRITRLLLADREGARKAAGLSE